MLATARLWREGFRFKKAGVTLLELSPAASVQGDLWTASDSPRSQALMKAMDRINALHGRETVKLAASGIERKWKLRSEKRSPHYTTDWNDLLRVE